MSLLQNQDFIIYRIRSRYLQCMKDGVGERLITLNPAPLNVPAFKNAGWTVGPEIKRIHSPPIPTGSAGEYFTGNAGRSLADETSPALGAPGAGDDVAVLGSQFSMDSMDTGAKTPKVDNSRGVKRMQHREEDDSSDMSDESEEEDQNPENPSKIQFDFTKKQVPHRPRAGSSPIRNGPQVLVTSPSTWKGRAHRARGGSHGDVDFKAAGDPVGSVPGADEELLSSGVVTDKEKMHAEIASKLRSSPNSSLPRENGYDSGDESDASSTMSSDFIATADSNPHVIGNSLSPPSRTMPKTPPAVFHALPPPIRPVSQIQPVSALTRLLKAKASEAEHPMEEYRVFSGKGELTPVYLKIYMPLCSESGPFEVVVNRITKEEDGRQRETTVAEAIGFTLYRYIEDKKAPPLKPEQADINRWTFRMVDDGEPDDDFPPLERTQPITSYMAKKARGRFGGASREAKVEGEFALVEATEEQYLENCRVTPGRKAQKKPATGPVLIASTPMLGTSEVARSPAPTVGPSARQAAVESAMASAAAARTGPSKILRIHVASIDQFAQSHSICVTTDTYIAEVLEQVCKKKGLDKSKFILRVTGAPNVVAPLDRTVASLGDRAELDLVRRRFIGATEGIGDRPGSPSTVESPNAPLIISAAAGSGGRTPKKAKFLQPQLWTPDMLSSRDYLKFTVWRKQSMSMSFMSRHERILAIDGEYVHITPPDQKTLLNAFESQAKTRSIHINTIIGCKQYRKAPSNFKILVWRAQQKDPKRYDFEAMSEEQAAEVVAALKRATMEFRMDHPPGV